MTFQIDSAQFWQSCLHKTTHGNPKIIKSLTKLHGNENDFILIDEYDCEVSEGKSGFVATYCDRRCGIGADSTPFLTKSDHTDISMWLFQPDQSEAEICGK